MRRSPAFPIVHHLQRMEHFGAAALNQNIVIIRLKYPAHSSKLFHSSQLVVSKQEQKNKKIKKLGTKTLRRRRRHRIYSAMIGARFTVPTTQPAVAMRENQASSLS